MVLGLSCLLKTTIQVPVCIQAMLLSLDHKKESVINFHLHIFVVGCDQFARYRWNCLLILICWAYHFSGTCMTLSIDKYVYMYAKKKFFKYCIICCFLVCFQPKSFNAISNIHCTLVARVNSPRLVNAKCSI